jgi:hypothetical protein
MHLNLTSLGIISRRDLALIGDNCENLRFEAHFYMFGKRNSNFLKKVNIMCRVKPNGEDILKIRGLG